jgi:ABC-2 type transport system ATP-binding protein
MSPAIIQFSHVSKRFGDVEALRDVSFTVDASEVIAFLGPNGAGKTTSISIMLGLRRPTLGAATLLGLDPRDRRARSQTGVMLQESGVPGNLKVRELVDLFRSYYPSPLPLAAAIERAGLEEKTDALAGSLSGGERQRLYFALAICGNPSILFLDEPTTSLDVEGRRLFWAQVRDFVRSGRTVVLTTHYLEEADALADRVVVIDHGRIIADGSPAAIKGRVAGKRISFESARPLDEGAFIGLPVQSVTLDDHRVTLLTNEPEDVLKALFARQVDIHDLQVVGAGLEEAFLALTSGGEPDERIR